MFVFMGLFLVTGFGFAMYKTFFSADFYRDDLVKSVHDFLVYEGQRYIEFSPVKQIKKSDFTAIMDDIITNDDLKDAVDDVVMQLKSVKVGDDGLVHVKITLDWLTRKGAVFGGKVADYLFENMPRCDSADESNYLVEFDCIPKDLPKEDFVKVFDAGLDKKFISDLPDSFDLEFNLPEKFAGENFGVFVKELGNKVFLVLVAALVVVLFLIGLLVFSPKIIVMKWMAKTIFFSSFIAILAVMFLNVFVPAIFDKLLQTCDLNIPGQNALMSLYILFIGALTVNLLKIVFPLAVISLVFWIVGMVYGRGQKEIAYGNTRTGTGYKELH